MRQYDHARYWAKENGFFHVYTRKIVDFPSFLKTNLLAKSTILLSAGVY